MHGSRKKTLWAWAAGTFLGAGLLKPGPGTYGSVAAVVLWFGAARLWQPGPVALSVWTAAAAIAVTLIGIPAATIVARESGRGGLGQKDPGHVVIDEVAGQLLALVPMPAEWRWAGLALVLFRVFDIWKPGPVRRLEKLPGGMGIMMDDVAAGVLAGVAGWVVLLVLR